MRGLWKASPNAWGGGKVHLVDQESKDGLAKTVCGQILDRCPGKPVYGVESDCKSCNRSLQSRLDWEKKKAQYDKEEKERQQQREAERTERTNEYHSYLKTPKWRAISSMVIARANGICEGCGKRPATQSHHLSYDHMGDEFLWELRAVCRECHERFHEIAE